MASAIDLCTVGDVRAFLAMVSGQPGNSNQTSEVSTSISTPFSAGSGVVVSPVTMANIVAGSVLVVDVGTSQEVVAVTAVSGSTFTATFTKTHSATPVPVIDLTDQVIGKLITSASNYWLWATGKGGGGQVPTASPFVAPQPYNEWYNGNGNLQLFLKQTPITTVTLLQINGVTVPASAGWSNPGYVIDGEGKSLLIRSNGVSGRGGYGFGSVGRGCGYGFSNGVQNINVQYSAGFNGVPPDVLDGCTEMVAVNFQRRRYLDQDQNAAPQTIGTITYSKLEVPKRVASIMDNYSRTAFA